MAPHPNATPATPQSSITATTATSADAGRDERVESSESSRAGSSHTCCPPVRWSVCSPACLPACLPARRRYGTTTPIARTPVPALSADLVGYDNGSSFLQRRPRDGEMREGGLPNSGAGPVVSVMCCGSDVMATLPRLLLCMLPGLLSTLGWNMNEHPLCKDANYVYV
ncbi:hypothetical protein COCMIDRAFT_25910 [Bipolaris oryzae ATCC 44560]|uniref:Uncharacterized protein n=1 Tax=Bipolaris oryzae ATCC 44560 TaxID=930090 RepID=W6ZEU5_COCMI|nr:uncharacterized protein COCMIDRAFT_25910 [Bipolaris oryzae ATCC 44560]EUC46034.1 hypothetical protein COCMIDRAFT_25910 [Bipolaris oryzae ATCC 44560]